MNSNENKTNWTQFWKSRWKQNQIGFHQSEFEPLLVRFMPKLAPTTVLVPLCGKTKDLIYLAQQGHQVIGVELSELACKAFFEENGIAYQIQTCDSFQVYHSDSIEIWCGDFFQLTATHVSNVSFVFDRACLIALPLELRKRYATHLQTILKSAQILLVVIDYDQSQMSGPPFAVSDAEVRELYANAKIELLSEEADRLTTSLGVTAEVIERAYGAYLT